MEKHLENLVVKFFEVVKCNNINEFEKFFDNNDVEINQAVNEQGQNFLHLACILYNIDMIRFLLKKGANVNSVNPISGETPIHLAAQKGFIDIIILLVENGADPFMQTKKGCTCLHFAAQNGFKSSVLYFLSLGVDPTIKDNFGLTAFMYTTSNKDSLDCARIISSYIPENILEVDKMGNDALQLAVLYDNITAVKFLINKGFDIQRLNHFKESSLDLANKNSRSNIANCLKYNLWVNGLFSQSPLLRYFQSHKYKKYLTVGVFGIIPPLFSFLLIFKSVYLNMFTLFLFIGMLMNYYNAIKSYDQPSHVFYGLNISVFIMAVWVFFSKDWNYYVVNYVFICSIFQLSVFFITKNLNPGYIISRQEDKIRLIKSLKEDFSEKKASRICTTCLISRPIRSKHCSICEKCVERFDHHCPWANNCIGLKNYGSFILYVASTCLLSLLFFVTIINQISNKCPIDVLKFRYIYKWICTLNAKYFLYDIYCIFTVYLFLY